MSGAAKGGAWPPELRFRLSGAAYTALLARCRAGEGAEQAARRLLLTVALFPPAAVTDREGDAAGDAPPPRTPAAGAPDRSPLRLVPPVSPEQVAAWRRQQREASAR